MPLATFPDCQLAVQPLGVEVPVATTASFSDPPVSTNATVLTWRNTVGRTGFERLQSGNRSGTRRARRGAVTGFGICYAWRPTHATLTGTVLLHGKVQDRALTDVEAVEIGVDPHAVPRIDDVWTADGCRGPVLRDLSGNAGTAIGIRHQNSAPDADAARDRCRPRPRDPRRGGRGRQLLENLAH